VQIAPAVRAFGKSRFCDIARAPRLLRCAKIADSIGREACGMAFGIGSLVGAIVGCCLMAFYPVSIRAVLVSTAIGGAIGNVIDEIARREGLYSDGNNA
jgi:hypothetical protein